MSKRYVLAMMRHETNTFSPLPTELRHFSRGSEDDALLSGQDAIDAYQGTTSPFAGFYDLIKDEAEIDVPCTGNAWLLDALRSGRQCVVDGNAIEFWRADTGEELTLEMQRPGTEGVAVINWPVGVAEAPWPVSMPLVNEALYVLRRAGWTEAALIRVMVLNPEVVQHSQTAIAWLAAHGCSRQAELLMSDLE